MMKCKKWLQPINLPNCISQVLVLLRVVVGLAFIFHGWGKIQNPMGWMPPEAPVPGILQALAAISEFGGGIALILGLLTSLALLGMIVTMAVAVAMHAFVMHDPFVNPMGGSSYELALVYFSIFAVMLATGPGKYSADAKIFGIK